VGLRGNGSGDRVRYELALFRMNFDNQIIPANSNSEFQVTNGGKTLHQGLEAGFGVALGAGFSLDTNFTYIPDAHFVGDRFSRAGALTTPDGNRIPYTPEWVANVGFMYGREGFSGALYVNHTGAQYTDVLNTRDLAENVTGFFTGPMESYTLVNVNLSYDVNGHLNIVGAVRNLTDERYIASLRQGLYVGPTRAVDVGLRYRF
jgi:Fe(3+) dicitrate transport protein